MTDLKLTRRALLKAGSIGALALLQSRLGLSEALSDSPIASSLGSTLHLAALGYSKEQNREGVRLRWLYPVFRPNGQRYTLPEQFIVERILLPTSIPILKVQKVDVGLNPTSAYPTRFWVPNGLRRIDSPTLYVPAAGGPTSFFAVTFVCRIKNNTPCILILKDTDGACLASFTVMNGQRVYFEAPDLAAIEIIGANASNVILDDLLALDTRGDQKAALSFFKQQSDSPFIIRRVGVRKGLQQAHVESVASRLPGAPSDDTKEWWKTTVNLAQWVYLRTPSTPVPTGLGTSFSADDLMVLLLHQRWEYAVYSGFGMLDGPLPSLASFDQQGPQPGARRLTGNEVALYRVRTVPFKDDGALYSNVVAVDARTIPALAPPSPFQTQQPTIWTTRTVSDLNADPPSTPQSALVISGSVTAGLPDKDPWVDGVMFSYRSNVQSNVITTILDPASGWIFEGNRRFVHKNFELPTIPSPNGLVDASISITGASYDNWDRTSTPITITPRVTIDDDLVPPQITDANLNVSGAPDRVQLTLAPWSPSQLIRPFVTDGRITLDVYRQIASPRTMNALVTGHGSPSSEVFNEFQLPIEVLSEGKLDEFAGGICVLGTTPFTIVRATQSVLKLRLPEGAIHTAPHGDAIVGEDTCATPPSAARQDTLPIVSGEIVTLRMPESHLSLWTAVSNAHQITPSIGLTNIDFPSDVLRSEVSRTLRYAVRLRFVTDGTQRKARLSNIVTLELPPIRPAAPPAFRVDVLGQDYYGRWLVEITFEVDLPDLLYRVIAAPGRLSEWQASQTKGGVTFASTAVDGLIGSQPVALRRTLFEVFPVSAFETKGYVTIAVGSASEGGAEGTYRYAEAVFE